MLPISDYQSKIPTIFLKRSLFYELHGLRKASSLGAVNFLPEISNRAGGQEERLPKFPVVLSENLPE